MFLYRIYLDSKHFWPLCTAVDWAIFIYFKANEINYHLAQLLKKNSPIKYQRVLIFKFHTRNHWTIKFCEDERKVLKLTVLSFNAVVCLNFVKVNGNSENCLNFLFCYFLYFHFYFISFQFLFRFSFVSLLLRTQSVC